MSNIKISVVITVYNIEKYIAECIESILNQNIEEIQIICVDDASTDNSYAILREYENKDNRIQIVLNEVNLGQASSRNRGCEKAIGKYIYIMDGDDLLKPGALKRLYDCAEAENLDILTFSAEAFADTIQMKKLEKRLEGYYVRKQMCDDVMTGPDFFSELIYNGNMSGNIVLQFINRKFFKKNNIHWIEGLRCFEDDPFEMYMKAKRVKCIQDILYMRRLRENSIVTSPHKISYLESGIIQLASNLQMWQTCEMTKEQNRRIEMYIREKHRIILSLLEEFNDSKEEMHLIEKFPVAKYMYDYFIKKESVICKNLTQEVLQKIKSYKNVIVYGAGKIAKEVVKFLEENEICNYNIAVSDKQDNVVQFNGKSVYKIDELIYMKENSIVIIATTRRYYKNISETLVNLKFNNIIYVD